MAFVSHAQNFEDVILRRALKHVTRGFYIDVGAAWPEFHSVTRAFYLMGWRGINIEPNPALHARLLACRPEDTNLGIVVSDREGEVDLHVFPNTGLSTADGNTARQHASDTLPCTTIRVAASRLRQIWLAHVPESQDVHFLKIDAEGLEREALQGNDWSVHRPWIVVVESTTPLAPMETHHSWESILLAASYSFAYADGLNRFYVDDDHPELLPAFKYPPNVFDDFVLAAERGADERRHLAEARAANADELRHAAEARAARAEEFLDAAEERAARAEASLHIAESRAAQFQQEVAAITASTSWKLTRPLRAIVRRLRLLRCVPDGFPAIPSSGLPSEPAVRLLTASRHLVNSSPLAKRLVRRLLVAFPSLHRNASRALASATTPAPPGGPTAERVHDPRLANLEKMVAFILDDLRRDHP